MCVVFNFGNIKKKIINLQIEEHIWKILEFLRTYFSMLVLLFGWRELSPCYTLNFFEHKKAHLYAGVFAKNSECVSQPRDLSLASRITHRDLLLFSMAVQLPRSQCGLRKS